MGKTMAKANVIWGEQHSVSLASFSSAHMAQIIDLIQKNIGPKAAIDHAAAQTAILKAKGNKKMKDGYVKVGLIGTDLVLRCKEKKFLGDIEVDAILVRGYPSKVTLWDTQKTLDQIEKAAQEKARREKAEREEAERKEKAARLHKVMNTPDQEGVTMREKILRAADKAQKLGVGDYAKNKLKAQGLTPMHEDYHGEVLDHQKNRYGRYLPQLRKVWEEHGPKSGSFSKWLDDVEANNANVPGVKEAQALTHPEVGKVVKPGGVAGGRLIYLDDESRKPYAARVAKGMITGGQMKGGDGIFVIGPDNKIYVGSKARAQPGVVGAFNHSSFFSGGPVKSAGSLKASGGRITEVNDVSGHYTPTRAMIIQAVRKFGGGDQAWLKDVRVVVGGKTTTGAQLLGEDHEEQSNEIWGKYSVGPMSREDAAKVLAAASDGNWLVRVGSNTKLVISYRQGDTVNQDLITNIGAKGLDRKKLLLPDQVRTLLQSVPSKPSTPSTQERESRETESQEKPRTRRSTTAPRRTTPESETRESETQEKPKATRPAQQRTASTLPAVTEEMQAELRRSPAWHGDLNRAGAEALLKEKNGAWLLREGRDKIVAFSRNFNGKLEHALMNDPEVYSTVTKYMAKYPANMVKP